MPRSFWLCLLPLILVAPARADDPAGALLFKQKCAYCHGPAGEGTKRYKPPLVGDWSVKQLTKYVHESMPEDDPGSLSPADAEKISAFLHDAFYSPVARDRLKPARISLARLTARQYRQAVADVVGSFRGKHPWDGQRGLKADYFNGRNFDERKRAFARTDALVDFDWGTGTPDADKMKSANEFYVHWQGSLLAPDTGEYQFILQSDQAVKLWVNDARTPLIDAGVRSANNTEYTANVFLTAGRTYFLKADFSKANVGVKKEENTPKPSFVRLMWKPPGGVAQLVPTRLTLPHPVPEEYVASTPFPPDDASLGWERGSAVSKEWDAAATDAAFDAANYVAKRLKEFGVPDAAGPERVKKAKEFCGTFLERAFRRPLNDDVRKAYLDRLFDGTPDVELAVRKAVMLALKSPRFLYREVGAATADDPFDVASRLAFGLWDSGPDRELLDAARAGSLKTPEQVRQQAERMMNDPRARTKLAGFFRHWLNVEHARDLSKDPKRFKEFSPEVIADLQASLEMTVDDVVWDEKSDFRKLLTGDEVFLNGRLAKFYGVEGFGEKDGWKKAKLDGGKRQGVLTHPYLLASNAYAAESSPIHRGVFLVRGVLGLSLRPPPEAFSPLAGDLHPTFTTRERVGFQTKDSSCMACHGVINPLGFTLENFDAVGRFRTEDNKKPIDSQGFYLTRSGETAKFSGPGDLAKFLADSPEVHSAFAEQLFHHVSQQPVRAYGADTQAKLKDSFAKNGYSVTKLMVECAAVAALPPKK